MSTGSMRRCRDGGKMQQMAAYVQPKLGGATRRGDRVGCGGAGGLWEMP